MSLGIKPGITAVLSLVLAAPFLIAQSNSADLQKKLNSEFALTKTTADRSDIVTAGAVLVLHKDGLVMYSTTAAAAPMNTYKDGKLKQNDFKDKWKVLINRGKTGSTDTTDV